MVREMITLPLRVGVSATRLGVRVTSRAAGAALRITRLVIDRSLPTQSRAAADAQEPARTLVVDVVVASSPPPEPAPMSPSTHDVAPAPEVPAAPDIPPAHVSEELRFVEAFAEPGAEEGAGAEVHVKEPWRHYSDMTADEVIVRLADAGPEELAAVALYESAHRRRKTVLAQARRELRLATASGPAPAGRA
jgi:hypothetical protein